MFSTTAKITAIIKSLEDITTAHPPRACLRLIFELSPAGVVNLVIPLARTAVLLQSSRARTLRIAALERVVVYFNISRNNPASSPSRFRPRLTSRALRVMITRGFDDEMPESESRACIGRCFDFKSGIREQGKQEKKREREGEPKLSSSSCFPLCRIVATSLWGRVWTFSRSV